MTLDKSLKISRGSLQNRNVLTRAERLKQLAEEERWNNGDYPFGLPKVRVAKVSLGRVKKVKDEVDEGLAEETAEPEDE